jgi:uncharacterized protein with HEPN domain
MNLEIKKLLQDVFNSIILIESHLQNAAILADYTNNDLIIDAVERRLAIIGEALWKADKKDAALPISNKKRIISLRHILVHDYDLVEDSIVWIICKKQLPILKTEIQSILDPK